MSSLISLRHVVFLLGIVWAVGCSHGEAPPRQLEPLSVSQVDKSKANRATNAADKDSNAQAALLAEEAFVMHQTLSVYLLGQEDIQDELGLDEEQRKAIGGIIRGGLKEYYRLWSNAGETANDSENAPTHPASAIAQRTETQLRELLRDQQLESLNRRVWKTNVGPVAFVRTGPLVFLQPDVERALGLTSAQRESIVRVVGETNETIASVTGSTFRLGRVEEILAAGRQSAEALLTASQRAKWAELLGATPDEQ